MKVGAFALKEPIPELKEPYVFAALWPWIDVGHVGKLILDDLERRFGARDLGAFVKPGTFFDFTRYRPTLFYDETGTRSLSIPNTTLRYAKRESGNDLLFLRLLEPHAQSETFVDSILRVLKTLKVKKYILLGSMSDTVPHTRPLIINGGAFGKEALTDLKKSGALSGHYEGPTSIATLITQKASGVNVESIWFIVSLPQYVNLEEDYIGKLRLMEVLSSLYHIPVDKKDYEKAAEQRELINQQMEKTPELKKIMPQIEFLYEARMRKGEGERRAELPPEIEEILWKNIGKEPGKA